MTTTGRLVTLNDDVHHHDHEQGPHVEMHVPTERYNAAIGLLERWVKLVDGSLFQNALGLDLKETALAADTRKFLAVNE